MYCCTENNLVFFFSRPIRVHSVTEGYFGAFCETTKLPMPLACPQYLLGPALVILVTPGFWYSGVTNKLNTQLRQTYHWTGGDMLIVNTPPNFQFILTKLTYRPPPPLNDIRTFLLATYTLIRIELITSAGSRIVIRRSGSQSTCDPVSFIMMC